MNIVSGETIKSYIITRARNAAPTDVFLIYDDNSWRFKEVLYHEMPVIAAKTGNAFKKLGVDKGDKVNLHCNNCIEYVYAFFGLASIGAVVIPTDIEMSEKEWEYVLNHSKAKAVVTEPNLFKTFDRIQGKCPSVKNLILCKTEEKEGDSLLLSDIVSKAPSEFPEAKISSKDDFVIYYERSKEGNPDGIVFSQEYYLCWGELISRALRLSYNEVVFCVNPISNPLNQINMLAALSANLKFVLGEKFLASDWIHQVGRFAPYWQKNMGRGLVGYLTADQARQVLLQEPTLRDGKNALRALLYAGELSESEVNHFANRFQTNIARYFGLAECGIPLMNPILENKPQSIGKPTIGIDVKVVDAQGGEVPVGKPGQMAINGGRGVTFCKGYYMDEKRDSKVIKGDWFYTDFNAKSDEEGYFYVIG